MTTDQTTDQTTDKTAQDSLGTLLDFYTRAAARLEEQGADSERLDRAVKVSLALSAAIEATATAYTASALTRVAEALEAQQQTRQTRQEAHG